MLWVWGKQCRVAHINTQVSVGMDLEVNPRLSNEEKD